MGCADVIGAHVLQQVSDAAVQLDESARARGAKGVLHNLTGLVQRLATRDPSPLVAAAAAASSRPI